MASSVRRERIALYALLTSLTALSIDALLPALRQMGLDLPAAPPLSTQHVVTLFVFGMVFGELALGPLSDAIGRKGALVTGLCVYGLGTLVALLSTTLEGVLVGRVLQGLGVAGPKIATRAMIRDQFEGEAMARVTRERRIPLRPRLLLANAVRILAHGRVTLLIAATGFIFGAQLLYLSIAADLFAEAYGIHESFPLYFALLASGIGLASALNGRLVQRFGMDAMARGGFVGLSLAGLALLAASLVTGGRPPFWLFLALGFAAFFAIGLLFGNLNAMAMRQLGALAGLGASLVASGSSLAATLFTLALGHLYDGTANVLAGGFFLAGSAALLLARASARRSDAPVAALR